MPLVRYRGIRVQLYIERVAGTLTLGPRGETRFFGQTSRSEVCMLILYIVNLTLGMTDEIASSISSMYVVPCSLH